MNKIKYFFSALMIFFSSESVAFLEEDCEPGYENCRVVREYSEGGVFQGGKVVEDVTIKGFVSGIAGNLSLKDFGPDALEIKFDVVNFDGIQTFKATHAFNNENMIVFFNNRGSVSVSLKKVQFYGKSDVEVFLKNILKIDQAEVTLFQPNNSASCDIDILYKTEECGETKKRFLFYPESNSDDVLISGPNDENYRFQRSGLLGQKIEIGPFMI